MPRSDHGLVVSLGANALEARLLAPQLRRFRTYSLVVGGVVGLALTSCGTTEPPPSRDLAAEFAERPEYQYEAKVMSAPHQVYPEEICVSAEESTIGEAFCFSNGMLGSVPEGEQFADYGDCTDVRTMGSTGHLPVFPPEPAARYSEATYVAEVDWLRDQIRSSGCACCHDSDSGYANVFDIGLGSDWVGTMSDESIVLAAGRVGEGIFVTVPPEDNFGFAQGGNVFAATDPGRMREFFEREVEYRGITDEEIEQAAAFYASIPFASLLDEVPEPCPEGNGVDADGTLHWTLPGVRFLNVLQGNEENPNIPPLDSPSGTLWRFEATAHADAMEPNTVLYGEPSSEARAQRFPRDGSEPAALVEGEIYTLFVTTRMSGANRLNCTFTYPITTPGT